MSLAATRATRYCSIRSGSTSTPCKQLPYPMGSNIAVHRPAWVDDRSELDAALDATREQVRKGHWQSSTARRYSF